MPTQTQLTTCAGALALHLGSRLNAVWGAAPAAGAPNAVGGGYECKWVEQRVEQLQLPAFPDMPEGGFPIELLPLAPIPALLPRWLHMQWLHKSAQVWQPIGPPTLTETHAGGTQTQATGTASISALAAGAGVGMGAAALVSWIGMRGADHLRRRGRGQMRPRLTTVHG